MSKLKWDEVGSRTFESGLDHGVLYLPDGSAVPWNGLTSVSEEVQNDVSPIYFDGMKINDFVRVGDFSASLKAVTYPDEFSEIEGVGKFRRGIQVGNQKPKTFSLCYRTMVGNDLDGAEAHYKLHLLFNLIATPNSRSYESITDDPSIVEFEWNLTAVPQEIDGFMPTACLTFDSRELDPYLLEDLEEILYGSDRAFPKLLPMEDMVRFLSEWYRIKIIDNSDGTWTATSDRPGFIQFMNDVGDLFQITKANATYLDDHTYTISDTLDIKDVPDIKIVDNGDGTWRASTEHDNLIVMLDDSTFEIRNASLVFESEDMFRISDTSENE